MTLFSYSNSYICTHTCIHKHTHTQPNEPTRLLATGGCDNAVKVWRFEGDRTPTVRKDFREIQRERERERENELICMYVCVFASG